MVCSIQYLSLHHAASVVAHCSNRVEHVDVIFDLYPLELCEQSNEGARPAHSSTTVHNYWAGIDRIVSCDFAYEMQQSSRVVGNAMVRPDCEVKLCDGSFCFGSFFLQGKGPHSVVGND